MRIEFDSNDKFSLEWNEYQQFSLYNKEGKAQHYQMHNFDKVCKDSRWIGWSVPIWTMVIEAHPITSLTVETKEEKAAKESVKKAKEAFKGCGRYFESC